MMNPSFFVEVLATSQVVSVLIELVRVEVTV